MQIRKNSLDSELQISSICSIGIHSNNGDIFKSMKYTFKKKDLLWMDVAVVERVRSHRVDHDAHDDG